MNACDASLLISELRKMHASDKGWIFIPELRMGTGYGGLKEQRLDAWAINAWGGTVQNLRRSFEVKVSAADMLLELRNPDKRWAAYAVSNEFYFVTPWNLVRPKMLTKDDGLIEFRDDCLKITKAPRVREAMPPRWDFVASLARRITA